MTHQDTNIAERIIRKPEYLSRLSVSKSTLADWENPKSKRYRPDCPKKIKLGANSVGYLESEVNAFIKALAGNRTETV